MGITKLIHNNGYLKRTSCKILYIGGDGDVGSAGAKSIGA